MPYETNSDLNDDVASVPMNISQALRIHNIYKAVIPLTLINTFVCFVADVINNDGHHGRWGDAFLCSMRKIRPLIPTEQLCHEDQQRIIKALKNQDRHTRLPPDFQDFFRSETNATCGTVFGQKCPVGEQLESTISTWDNGLANMTDIYLYLSFMWPILATAAFTFYSNSLKSKAAGSRAEEMAMSDNPSISDQGWAIIYRENGVDFLWIAALTNMMYGVMFLVNIFHDQSYNSKVLEGLAQTVNQACPENNATLQCCHVSRSMSAITNKDLPSAMENDKVFRHWATAPFFLWTSALLVDLAFRCGRKYGRRFFASNADAGPNDATNDDDVELLDLVDLANDDDAGPNDATNDDDVELLDLANDDDAGPNDATNDDDTKEQDNPHRFFGAPNTPSACRTNAPSEHTTGPSNT